MICRVAKVNESPPIRTGMERESSPLFPNGVNVEIVLVPNIYAIDKTRKNIPTPSSFFESLFIAVFLLFYTH
jgi:hypothetical protein